MGQLGINDIVHANKCWNDLMSDYRHTIHIYEGFQQLFANLREQSIATGVVTSKTKKEFQDDFVPLEHKGEKCRGTRSCSH